MLNACRLQARMGVLVILLFVRTVVMLQSQSEMQLHLSFNFNEFYFHEKGATISWNIAGSCNGIVSYHVLKLLGSMRSELNTTKETTFLITDDHLRSNQGIPKFYVEAYCNANSPVHSDYSLVIPSQVYTIEKYIDLVVDFCLNPPDYTLSVIMPVKNNSAEKSCICNQLYNIKSCIFVENGECSEVYNNNSNTICWQNISNGSIIHFAREKSNPSDLINFPSTNLEFKISFAIYDSPAQFTFRFSEFYLEKDGVTISWNTAGPCDGRVSYHVMRAFSGVISMMSYTNETKFKITEDQLEELPNQPKFYVDAYCNDNFIMRSNYSLIFPREVYTMKNSTNLNMDFCVNPRDYKLSVIMPITNISVDGSCICEKWFRLDQCKNVQDGLCNTVDNIGTVKSRFEICWRNISSGTKIHFIEKIMNAIDRGNRLSNPAYSLQFTLSYQIFTHFEMSSSPTTSYDNSGVPVQLNFLTFLGILLYHMFTYK